MKGLNVLLAVAVARADYLRVRPDAKRPRAAVIPFA